MSSESPPPTLTACASLEGHTDRVWHVAWHPTLQVLVSCGGDKTVRVWAPAPPPHGAPAAPAPAWHCICTLDDFATRTVRTAEWSPCGRFLAASSFDSNTTVWRVSGGALSGGGGGALGVGSLSFSVVAVLEGHDNEVKGVAWAPSGRLLATCGRDKSVWLWETVDEPHAPGGVDFECVAVLHGHEGDVKAVAWHPRRELLASASYDDTVRVWGEGADADWECVQTLGGVHSSTVWAAAFERRTGGLLATVSDDRTLVVYAASPPPPGSTAVADALLYAPVVTLRDAHARTALSVAWGRSVDGGGCGGVRGGGGGSGGGGEDKAWTAGAWDGEGAADGMDDAPPPPLPHSAILATAGCDDAIRVFRVSREEASAGGAAVNAGAGGSSATDAGATAGGCAGAQVARGTWAITPLVHVPNAHRGDVNVVRWSKGNDMLASGGDDGVVRLWAWRDADA